MAHRASEQDQTFRERFEACEVSTTELDHASHIRLAYTYLVDHDVDAANRRMQSSLVRFLRHNGMSPTKYHETLTRAWVLAVRHFMEEVAESDSAASFMQAERRMLDKEIMLTHYSASLLFSDDARERFVEPNLSPIPRYRR